MKGKDKGKEKLVPVPGEEKEPPLFLSLASYNHHSSSSPP
jgi:hypothetical protein